MTMNANEMQVGQIVAVGPKYVMSNHQPHIGNGHFENDEWTGKLFRVVKINSRDADLAPTNLVGADETDAVVSVVFRRLTVQGEWTVE